MEQQRTRVIFAAGGTGGHLFPALTIADEVRKREPKAEVVFIGTKDKLESTVVPKKGYLFKTIWISGFSRGFRLNNLLFPIKLFVSVIQSFFLIRKIQPSVVVGTGGFVAGPVVFVATILKIPTLIQEQNSYPGVTTRWLAKRVNEVHIAFEISKKYLKRADQVKVTGNPTHDSLGVIKREAATRFFMLDPDKKTLLIVGGSLGATSINTAVLQIIDEIVRQSVQVLWQTGERDYERIQHATSSMPMVKVFSFIDSMEYAYAAADLVVSRAGATTVAELTRVGKPAILVPYPFAAANHQVENAKGMVERGAAILILDRDLKEKLRSTILRLIYDDQVLKAMSKKTLSLAKPNAARDIAEAVLKLAKSYGSAG